MFKLNFDDTIAAISTPLGQAGIGIVRLSGKDALSIADKVFLAKGKKKASRVSTYTTHYGWIVNGSQGSRPKNDKRHEVIDEVLLTVMRAPRSYTKEDIVEINCHSGIVPLRKILDLVLRSGARLAEPGEFTRRAFINGRIDLVQAEAVLDIIQSKTDQAFKVSVNQLKGELSERITQIREQLLEILAHIEAEINFPEEDDVKNVSYSSLQKRIKKIETELTQILNFAAEGKMLREGVSIAICGRPNVGKSSLLNALIKKEKAIVTSIAGTTRDAVEDMVSVAGFPVRFIDTAGIATPKDEVEKAAVKKSRENIEEADIILLLFDGSRHVTKKDRELIVELKGKNIIFVVNKIDLGQKINLGKLQALCATKKIAKISALKKTGLSNLERNITKRLFSHRAVHNEQILISNIRHIELLKSVKKSINQAQEAIEKALPEDFIAEELRLSLEDCDAIIGKNIKQDLLDKIFSEFCIGK
ncbi:tRNA uridine-5-carboxymethylaminomethyl(34) synthesis GTPase MnmE [Candidatus Omnitrophota bacterium]